MKKIDYSEFDREIWNKFVDDNSYGWLLQRSEFLEAWSFVGDNMSFAIAEDRELLALFVMHKYHHVIIKKKLGGLIQKKKEVYNLDSFGGFVIKDGLSEKKIHKVQEFFKKEIDQLLETHKISHFTCEFSASTPALLQDVRKTLVNPLVFWGFENRDYQANIIDLKAVPEDQIYRQSSETTRQEIKKISNDPGFKSYYITTPSLQDLEIYYRLHLDTYHRTGAKPFARSYFEHFFFDLLPKGLCRILFLVYKDDVVAANITACYKKNYEYFANASDMEFLQNYSGANKFLLYQQILNAQKEGGDHYNIGNVLPYVRAGKLMGLTRFKSSIRGGGGGACAFV